MAGFGHGLARLGLAERDMEILNKKKKEAEDE